MRILPEIHSKDQYFSMLADESVWLPAVRLIASRHGFVAQPKRMRFGTQIVYALGNVILKIYCPLWAKSFEAELIVLDNLHDLPAPSLRDWGKIDGWPYLVQSRIVGVPAGKVWGKLSPSVRCDLVREIGVLMRRLHDQPLPTGLDDNWDSFLKARLEGAEEHHRACEPWNSWLKTRIRDFTEPRFPNVLLHADLTDDHFLLSRREDRSWFVSGIIDFGDARIGHPFYDFVVVLGEYTLGEPDLSRHLLQAYGLEMSREVQEGLLNFLLLHEFGTLWHLLERYPMQEPGDLRRAVWGRS